MGYYMTDKGQSYHDVFNSINELGEGVSCNNIREYGMVDSDADPTAVLQEMVNAGLLREGEDVELAPE